MNDNQLQQLLQAINTLQDLGKVAYFNKGAYNSETTYEINDVVTYQGSSYVSLGNNNQGNLPTNATYWSVVALKGDKGDTGKPFVIEKTYISIQEMVADYDNMNVNDYVMISGSIEDEQNATLWTKRETPAPTYKWVYLADFSGASGITGQTPNIQIGNVTEGNEPAVTRRQGSTNENPILDFVLKTGAKGDTGATGNGISQVSKTSTSGLTDTYTIEYTSSNSTTFDVTNGKGITSIAKTSTSGLVDTYTITYNDGTTSTFTITNGEDGEVTQAQLDETNNQVAKANMVYNALPKVSDEGDSLTLDGTANCPMKMELKGNTQQDSYTGKNLYKWSNVNFSSNETTTSWCFQNGSGGAHDSNVTDKTMYKFELGAGTYKMSANSIDANILYIQAVKNSFPSEVIVTGNTINPTTLTSPITLTEPTIICVRYRVTNPSLGIGNTKIQIEEGSTATSYEPYVGGTPSPNPDYPQDVRVVTGNNNVNVQGKNLFDKDNANIIPAYIGENQNWVYSGSAICYRIKCKPNTSYTFSLLNTNETIFRGAVTDSEDIPTSEQSLSIYSVVRNTNNTPIIVNTTTNSKYILVQVSAVQYLTSLETLQIEEGSTATPYEPYQSQTYPINLGTMELCKIGTYQDYIYKDNGKWYKHSEIGKVVLDGSESNWNKGSTTQVNRYVLNNFISNYNVSNLGFNNYFKITNLATATIGTCYINATQLAINFDTYSSSSTINDFKTWLSTHNTEVYYVLATPTNTEITDTTLISQLNAIENAVSYDTQTNIVQENYSEPFIINAECVRSLKDIFELIGNS